MVQQLCAKCSALAFYRPEDVSDPTKTNTLGPRSEHWTAKWKPLWPHSLKLLRLYGPLWLKFVESQGCSFVLPLKGQLAINFRELTNYLEFHFSAGDFPPSSITFCNSDSIFAPGVQSLLGHLVILAPCLNYECGFAVIQ